MDFWVFVAVVVVLAFPFMAIVAMVMAARARRQASALEGRIASLEGRLAAAGAAAAPPIEVPRPATEEPTVAEEPKPEERPELARAPEPTPEPAVPARELGFEERFGTRWTVWVGGLALALGGIFLVRYSIEQGLLGPGVRILLGALFAAALVIAGERTRRMDNLAGVAGLPSAHIPAILTAAGTTVAYATTYAAYALYGFLPPAAAFLLLGAIAIATLAAALLHGPALAALGLIGAYVAPVLIQSDEPNFWALYLYLTVVTGAAFALANLRRWLWLAVAAVALGLGWLLVGGGLAIGAQAFYAVAGFALAAALLVAGFLFGPEPAPNRVDSVSSGAPAAYVFGAAALVLASGHDGLALIVFAGLVAATVALAWRAESASVAVPVAALLCAVVMGEWAADTSIKHLVAPPGPLAGALPELPRAATGAHLALGFGFAALFGAAGFLAQGRSAQPLVSLSWAASAVFVPVAVLIALYALIAQFDRSIPFAALALALAAIFGIATEVLNKRTPRPGLAAAVAIFAVGAIASLALALTMALEKGWLTVALALMVPGIAYVAERRPLPILRWLAAGIGVIVLVRIGAEPRIVGADVGTTPVFNWLLWGYGVPALAFWLAGHLLRRRADDVPARMADSLAILFTVLFLTLEIRHYMNDGDIYRPSAGLGELALQVCSGLAMAIGLERVRGRTGSIVHDYGALIIAAGTLALIVIGLLMRENPLFTGQPVGGRFFNLILLGYGIPAVLAIALALVTRLTRPMAYRVVAAVTAVVLALVYLSLEVRTLYHGPVLTPASAITDAEQYTYSAVWLVFGVVLLLVGIVLGSKPARLASAAVLLLTIGKVFLVDMAGLQGAYRALSFIGLGLVLVGIGWLYQRLLFPAVDNGRNAAGPGTPASRTS